MIHLITALIAVEPYKVTLKFNTSEIWHVDLETKLKGWSTGSDSKFAALLNPEYFNAAKLNLDFNSVFWANGIDLCRDVLYNLSLQFNRQNEIQLRRV